MQKKLNFYMVIVHDYRYSSTIVTYIHYTLLQWYCKHHGWISLVGVALLSKSLWSQHFVVVKKCKKIQILYGYCSRLQVFIHHWNPYSLHVVAMVLKTSWMNFTCLCCPVVEMSLITTFCGSKKNPKNSSFFLVIFHVSSYSSTIVSHIHYLLL